MSAEQYRPWRAEAEVHYAQSVAATGRTAAEAAREAAESYQRLLPQAEATPGHHIWYAYDGERRVGFLWIKVADGAAFVYNVAVEEGLRRQGYGRAIMLAAERWCRENGLTRIGLHVFAHNTGARLLYERLGFVETGRSMTKPL